MAVFDEHQNVIMGAAGQGGGYTIDQSIRFNDDDSAYLTKTFAGAGDDATAGTISVWVKRGNLGSIQYIFANADTNNTVYLRFESNDIIGIVVNNGGATKLSVQTTAVYRDVSSWYHLVFQVDTSQGSASARRTFWVNGVEPSLIGSDNLGLDEALDLFQNNQHYIGRDAAGRYLDGYLSEYNGIDGQALAPTEFGKFNNDGVWVPIEYTGTYGTNGFYITGADSADLGADYSGNGNDFTSSGLTSDDQVTDTPTDNFTTINRLIDFPGTVFSNGNLDISFNIGTSGPHCPCTIAPNSGKWYWEVTVKSVPSIDPTPRIGVEFLQDFNLGGTVIGYLYQTNGTTVEFLGTGGSVVFSSYGDTFTTNDVISVAWDLDNGGLLFFAKNGTWQNSATQSEIEAGTGTNAAFTDANDADLTPSIHVGGDSGGSSARANFGQQSFVHTVPSGFKALSTANLPNPTIADPSAYFQTTVYTGNGTAIGSGGNAVDQSGNSTFQPDFVWIKNRDAADNHMLYDAVRGATKDLHSNSTATEVTDTEGLSTFDTDGFTVGSNVEVNTNTENYAAWQWKANGAGSSNTDGSITSTVSANTTSGFSICTYTGNGTSGATFGHGLGVAPKMVIVKERSPGGNNWMVGHDSLGWTKYLALDAAQAAITSSARWNNTAPSSTVVTLGNDTGINASGATYVAYCFAEVEGFSKIGSYTGNGSSNGPFIYTGFRPAFILYKNTTTAGTNWDILDNTRETYNTVGQQLYANLTNAEAAEDHRWDFVSNGFKSRDGSASNNQSGATIIYAAFAESPFKYANAR